MKAKVLFAILSSILFAQVCPAQIAPEKNPIVVATNLLGERGLTTMPKPAKSPTTFTRSEKDDFVKAYIAKSFDTKEQREAAEPVFSELISNVEKATKEAGFGNDAAANIAFSVCLLDSLTRGKDLDEEGFQVMVVSLQAYYDTPDIRNATSGQKQQASEWALCSLASVLVHASVAKTEEDMSKVKLVAAATLKLMLSTDLDQLKIDGKNTKIIGKPSTAKPPVGEPAKGGMAPGFSFEIPQGWVKDTASSWYVSRFRDPRYGNNADTVSALVRFLPPVPAQGSFSDAIRKAWKDGVPPELADKASNMVFRRYIGDGLFAQFIFGRGMEKGRESSSLFSVYLIDCGSMWQPVVVAQIWDPAYKGSVGAEMSAGFSYSTSSNMAEEFFKMFRCPSAKGKPIVDRQAIIGDYTFGSSSSLMWENIYTGASAMTFVSYGGGLNLKADGTFAYTFSSASGLAGAAKFRGAKGAGKWRIDGDLLITTYSSYDQGDSYKRTEEKYRIAGVIVFSDGVKVCVLTNNLKKAINASTVGDGSDYYTTKK